MKYLPPVFAGLLVLFAALQWNDPDPLTWMALYLAAAFLCMLAARRRLRKPVAWLAAVLYAAGAWYQWPSVYEGLAGDMDGHPGIETARESLGLLICAAAVLASYYLSPSHARQR